MQSGSHHLCYFLSGWGSPRPHRRRESPGVHGASQEALRVISGLSNKTEDVFDVMSCELPYICACQNFSNVLFLEFQTLNNILTIYQITYYNERFYIGCLASQDYGNLFFISLTLEIRPTSCLLSPDVPTYLVQNPIYPSFPYSNFIILSMCHPMKWARRG